MSHIHELFHNETSEMRYGFGPIKLISHIKYQLSLFTLLRCKCYVTIHYFLEYMYLILKYMQYVFVQTKVVQLCVLMLFF